MMANTMIPNNSNQWPSARGTPKVDVFNMLEARIRQLEERLLLVEPQFQMMDTYPALREAYNEYKTIERLIIQGK